VIVRGYHFTAKNYSSFIVFGPSIFALWQQYCTCVPVHVVLGNGNLKGVYLINGRKQGLSMKKST
jgi:hypothetical protein